MREDLLHFLWRYQKFDEAPLQTTTAEMVYVLDKGQPIRVRAPTFLWHRFRSAPSDLQGL